MSTMTDFECGDYIVASPQSARTKRAHCSDLSLCQGDTPCDVNWDEIVSATVIYEDGNSCNATGSIYLLVPVLPR